MFDYFLPSELIAQEPSPQREESRLMVLRRDVSGVEHRLFKDILYYLSPGDCLVLNETKVIPARLRGVLENSGGEVEVLLLKEVRKNRWEALLRPGRRVKEGALLSFGGGRLLGMVMESTKEGGRVIEFALKELRSFGEILAEVGEIPLPPYIKNSEADPKRYQTVYARREGSVAAPTAGLHFTEQLLGEIRSRGVKVVCLSLHVGLGTFRPVRVDDITRHVMHAEYFEISGETARVINEARENKGRVIAVGTTTTRCLETVAEGTGEVVASSGWTRLFIYPGYRFKVVGGMVTNFHLPRSTLLMMVSAFAGLDRITNAYRLAIEKKYRFFSFGDAMLIL